MPTVFTKHQKVSLRNTEFNEKWLHDRICDDPTILGLGDVRVLDRERAISGGGRLDLLLLEEEYDRRYEVEIQLGPTDPSHIIRSIEYWDVERRRYPAHEHVAVIIAESITTRFLNVMALLSGSIPMIAIQLDVLKVGEQLLLHFTQVLDLTELRVDDSEEDGGGGQTDRAYRDKKAGTALKKQCDAVLEMINKHAARPQAFNYLRGYVGLQSNGVVNNFIYLSPKPTKNYCHVTFRISNAAPWKEKCEEADIKASSKHKDRLRISIDPKEFAQHHDLIREIVKETVAESES
jgi:hypothetical protein